MQGKQVNGNNETVSDLNLNNGRVEGSIEYFRRGYIAAFLISLTL